MTDKATEESNGSELPHQVDVQWAVKAESWMPGNADIRHWTAAHSAAGPECGDGG